MKENTPPVISSKFSAKRRMLQRRRALAMAAGLLLGGSAFAADGTWAGGAPGGTDWGLAGNWVDGIVPGSTFASTNTDTAFFGLGSGAVTLGEDRYLRRLHFTANAGSYTIGQVNGPALRFAFHANPGPMNIDFESGAASQVINAPIIMGVQNATSSGRFFFQMHSSQANASLSVNGTISSATTSDANLLYLRGAGTSVTYLNGSIQDGGAAKGVEVIKSANSVYHLLGNNTYSGGTQIGGGKLGINTSQSLGQGVVRFTASSTLENVASGGGSILLGNAVSIESVAHFSGNFNLNGGVTLGGSGARVNLRSLDGGTVRVSSVISDADPEGAAKQLSFDQAGTVILEQANTYTGGTYLSNNGVTILNANALGTGRVTFNDNNMGILRGTSTSLTLHNEMAFGYQPKFYGDFNLAGDVFLHVAAGRNGRHLIALEDQAVVEISGSIQAGTGYIELQSNLTGKLILSGENHHSGGVYFFNGDTDAHNRLDINHANAIGTGALRIGGTRNENIAFLGSSSGAPITIDGNMTYMVGNLTFVGPDDLNFGTGAFILGDGTNGSIQVGRNLRVDAGTVTINGGIRDGLTALNNGTQLLVDTLTKQGSGALVLGGDNRLLTGGINLREGTLVLNHEHALGLGMLDVNGVGVRLDNTSGAALVLDYRDSGGSQMVSEHFWQSDVSFVGTNDLDLGYATVSLAGAGASRKLTVEAGNLTLSGAVIGSKVFLKDGAGVLTLTPNDDVANAFGDMQVNGGVLRLGNERALPAGLRMSGGVTELTAGSGDFYGTLGTGFGEIAIEAGGGGFSAYGVDRSVYLNGSNDEVTWGGTGWDNAAALLLSSEAATAKVTLENGLDLNAGTSPVERTIRVADGAAAVDARLSGTLSNSNGEASLHKTGAGTLELASANSYTGGTRISEGTLVALDAGALGAGRVTLEGGRLVADIAGGTGRLSNLVEVTAEGGGYETSVAAGTSYGGIGLSADLGDAQRVTVATLLAGTADEARTVSTSYSANPGQPLANDVLRRSEVFHLEGTLDDVFVLQLQVTGLEAGSFLAWNDGASWVNAIAANSGTGAGAVNFQGYSGLITDWEVMADAFYLGAWGYHLPTGTVWAVLDHNSEFSVLGPVAPIPEPGTALMLLVGGGFALVLRRRFRKGA